MNKHNTEVKDSKGFSPGVPANSESLGVSYGDEALDDSGALPKSEKVEISLKELLSQPYKPHPIYEFWVKDGKAYARLRRKRGGDQASNVIPFKKPRKAKPLKPGLAKFYAWENEYGEISKQRGFKGSKAEENGKKGADLYSIAKFIKGGNGTNRNLENFVSVNECYSDLDPDFNLEWTEIVEKAKDLPLINKIVRSRSANHFQVHWKIPDVKREGLDLWLLVQEKIFELLKPLGADPLAVKDPIRYLRDPGKYEVVYSNDTNTNLSELYEAFKKLDAIKSQELQEGEKIRRRYQQSFSKVSLPRLRRFFTDNPLWEGTYKELSENLSIPERSIYHLMNVLLSEGLRTETFRVGRTWKTRFTFDTARKDSLTGGGVYGMALAEAKRVGIAENYRNVGVFVLSLWLSVHRKMSPERVLMELDPVFIAIDKRSVGFSRSEFERTVKSACREKYKCFAGFKNRYGKLQCLIEGIH